MGFRFPAPPPHSCFQTGKDELGRTFLRWQRPNERSNWRAALFLGLWLCPLLAWSLGDVLRLCLTGSSQVLGPVCVAASCVVVILLVVARFSGLFRRPEPEGLIFETDSVCYVGRAPALHSDVAS